MPDHSPKVSVCIPSYNAARFLPAAIDSVLAQEFTDFELIVSDDASDDETPKICKNYSDPRFRSVRSEDRLGQAGNWNRCIALARGEYVSLLHADDALLPGCLRRAVDALDTADDAALVHCSVQNIDEAGNPLELHTVFDHDTVDRNDVTLLRLLLDGCVINPAGVMVRRQAYEVVGPFPEVTWANDWHMWIRIALRWPVAYLAEPLALYRKHEHSLTSANMASGRNAWDETWAANDLFDLIERVRPDLCELKAAAMRGVAHRTWCVAEAMCERGNMPAARTGLRNAVRICPGMAREPKVWGLWAATYAGYRWFHLAHEAKHRLSSTVRRRVAPAD